MRIAETSDCSVKKLDGFGEKTPVDTNRSTDYHNNIPAAKTLKEFKEKCRSAVALYDSQYSGIHYSGNSQFKKQSVIIASAITTQPLAVEFLSQIFTSDTFAKEYPKYKHGLHMYSMTVSDFLEAIKE